MRLHNKLLAELFGTFWLVLGGCGSALLAATFMNDIGINIGLVGVSFAFGLTVMTMAYAVGHVSGGHFNPAVSLGLAFGGRFSWAELVPYWIAQVIGAVAAAVLLSILVQGNGSEIGTLASNGFDDASPGGYSMIAVIIMEVVMTAAFLFIIMGATDGRAPAGFDPARSTGPALVSMIFGGEGGEAAVGQLWVFWAAPMVGAVIGALAYRMCVAGAREETVIVDDHGRRA